MANLHQTLTAVAESIARSPWPVLKGWSVVGGADGGSAALHLDPSLSPQEQRRLPITELAIRLGRCQGVPVFAAREDFLAQKPLVFYAWRMADEHAIRAFTAESVIRLTGLTKRQLQYWDERGFIPPSLTSRAGRGRRRLYDFGDLVSLRVAADLRRNGVSLQEIRKIDRHLRLIQPSSSLSKVQVWMWEGKVYFSEADTIRAGRRPEQIVIDATVPVPAIIQALTAQIAELDQRRPGEVERRRGALGGKLLIEGTRIPVASVQRLRQDGAEIEEILEFYPDLTSEDVKAALALEAQIRRRKHAS